MIHRIALIVGAFTAAAVLALSLLRGDRPAVGAAPDPTAQATTEAEVIPATREVVDTVYVAAPKRPKVVHVTRHVPSKHPTIRVTTPRPPRSTGGEREHDDGEHEHEGGDD